jgi:hypothetical protein
LNFVSRTSRFAGYAFLHPGIKVVP